MTHLAPTIVHSLVAWASRQPNQVVYRLLPSGDDTVVVSLTIGELLTQATQVATQLRHLELSGHRVILAHGYGLSFIIALFGCFLAGVVPMPILPPRPHRDTSSFQHIILNAKPSAILGDRDWIDSMQHRLSIPPGIRWLASDTVDPGLSMPSLVLPAPSDIALIQFSSGSTSLPKGIVITHAQLMANQAMIQAAFGHTPSTVGVGWLPMYHDMGLIGNVLQCIAVGYEMILIPPLSFIQKPVRWFRVLSTYRGTSSGGPHFAYTHCVNRISDAELAGIDLSSWDLAFNGAEPILADGVKAFCQRFESIGFRSTSMYPCYGLAEATLIVSGGKKQNGPAIWTVDNGQFDAGKLVAAPGSRAVVGCGGVLNGDIQIVGPDATTVADGTIGEIWISGPSLSRGYWVDGVIDPSPFERQLPGQDGVYHSTGDMGAWAVAPDGRRELVVTGRKKEMMIINGRNVFPADVEAVLSEVAPPNQYGDTAVFSLSIDSKSPEHVVWIQAFRRCPADADWATWVTQLRSAVTRRHEIALDWVIAVPIGAIPKTSSGKVKRTTLRSIMQNDTLDHWRVWQRDPSWQGPFKNNTFTKEVNP